MLLYKHLARSSGRRRWLAWVKDTTDLAFSLKEVSCWDVLAGNAWSEKTPVGLGCLVFISSMSEFQAWNSIRRSRGLLKTSRNGSCMVLKRESELKIGKCARRPHLAMWIVSIVCYFICCFSGHLALISRIA